jgi:transposase-like protein
MDPIEVAIAAIKSREPGENFSYSQIAKDYGVVRTTLMRRHQRVTQARATANSTRQNLSQQQEKELLRYIKRLTKHSLPPTQQMIQSFTSTIAKKEVSLS